MYLFLSECLFLTQRTIKNSRDASEEPFYAFIRMTIQHILSTHKQHWRAVIILFSISVSTRISLMRF
jgi:hypothetical protein